MTQNNYYEHKLVSIGEEADNLIDSLRERNKILQVIVDSKKDVPEDFEQEKKVYQFKVDTVEKHNKKLREDLAKGFLEIHRILEDRGALILKFADVSISFRDLLNALDIDNVPLKPILPTVSKKGVNNTGYFFFVNYKPQ